MFSETPTIIICGAVPGCFKFNVYLIIDSLRHSFDSIIEPMTNHRKSIDSLKDLVLFLDKEIAIDSLVKQFFVP